MKIELAQSAGFCFGVRRAVDRVYELADGADGNVYTLGPIIHNEQVVGDLEDKGVRVVGHAGEIEDPGRATLVIRSHGVSRDTVRELEGKGIRFEDATCPFVKKIHDTVSHYSQKGYHIVIIGSAAHPEVQGILGWTGGRGVVVETPAEAEAFSLGEKDSDSDEVSPEEKISKRGKNPTKGWNPHMGNGQKICIVAQTTFNYKKFKDLVEIIEKKGYDIYVVNTICNATSTRQKEAEGLAARSDAMIVIGGRHSSNSRKLYEICKNQCANTFFIQTADDLRSISLGSFASLGITAGASTPNTIIQEVLRACQN